MLHHLLYLFFPDYCLTCSQILVYGEKFVCTRCFHDLPVTDSHVISNNLVMQRLAGRIPVKHALAFYQFKKASKVQKLIHQLKYQRKPRLGRWLGQQYGTILKEAGLATAFDLIVPVPLHRRKLQQRGYNQSDLFAQGLSEAMGIPWRKDGLVRVKDTTTQTRKNRMERLEHIAEAFQVGHKESVCQRRLLLVDDLITTGATVEACAHALLEAGVGELSVASIAIGA